jgi:hypothetical protein
MVIFTRNTQITVNFIHVVCLFVLKCFEKDLRVSQFLMDSCNSFHKSVQYTLQDLLKYSVRNLGIYEIPFSLLLVGLELI